MDKTLPKTCQLCGRHTANRVTTDHIGHECWSCGYCRRWHPEAIAAFLHVKRVFLNWKGTMMMQQSKQMQQIIEALVAKHTVQLADANAVLKLTLPGYMPLVIRNAGLNRVSVYHYFMFNGDVIPDPHILFWVTQTGWYALEVTQTIGGHRSYVRFNEEGTEVRWVNQRSQVDLARFAQMWAQNIQDQGWLTNASRLTEETIP